MADLQKLPDTIRLQLQSPDKAIQVFCSDHAPEFARAHREDFIANGYGVLVTKVPISAYQVISIYGDLHRKPCPLSKGGPGFVCILGRVPYAKESWRRRTSRACFSPQASRLLVILGQSILTPGKNISAEMASYPKSRIRLFLLFLLLLLPHLLLLLAHFSTTPPYYLISKKPQRSDAKHKTLVRTKILVGLPVNQVHPLGTYTIFVETLAEDRFGENF